MKVKITNKVKKELKYILDGSGYWSEETRLFIEQFDFISRNKLHQLAHHYDKYRSGLEV